MNTKAHLYEYQKAKNDGLDHLFKAQLELSDSQSDFDQQLPVGNVSTN